MLVIVYVEKQVINNILYEMQVIIYLEKQIIDKFFIGNASHRQNF